MVRDGDLRSWRRAPSLSLGRGAGQSKAEKDPRPQHEHHHVGGETRYFILPCAWLRWMEAGWLARLPSPKSKEWGGSSCFSVWPRRPAQKATPGPPEPALDEEKKEDSLVDETCLV